LERFATGEFVMGRKQRSTRDQTGTGESRSSYTSGRNRRADREEHQIRVADVGDALSTVGRIGDTSASASPFESSLM
jgi:hypothetical protein